MSKISNTQTGKKGEDLAVAFLENKGFEIVFRNFRYSRLEIDIIAKKGNKFVFVEVKSRKNNDFGFPEQTVSQKKARQVVSAAEHYLHINNIANDIRFDIVSITYMPVLAIEHFEDAFY